MINSCFVFFSYDPNRTYHVLPTTSRSALDTILLLWHYARIFCSAA